MAEIEIQWAQLGKLDGVTMDGNPIAKYPVMHVRYDPAWDPKMADHVHVVPLMAIADIQMTYDLDSPHSALEHCLLAHTADTLMSLKNWEEFQQFSGEHANRLKEKWAATQEYLVEEAKTMEVTSRAEMNDEVKSLAFPGALQKRMRMMGLRAPQGKMATLMSAHQTVMSVMEEHKAPHSLVTAADGFQEAAAILDTEVPQIDNFKEHLYRVRYAKQVDVVIEGREREAKRQRDLEKERLKPKSVVKKERFSEDQVRDNGADTGPGDRPKTQEPPRRPQV